ncbi:PREDICTED: F-box/FBD/LRR-repeat protein At1g13570-like [Nicotiana attenuata]|uniref:F-boxfbd/lrr-repeat protein n=1 Tax=Nicotiana attenuata TaxID=49451 RepID=A0A314KSN2_NICAT|nr:PREDICTED: F-box/FBD/LRR-repeat protein At1g13570-like [Nicotiana attenuata]OIT32293.1 f-boxfbd/lrr-repeat protein [Nicotiana attenuata]
MRSTSGSGVVTISNLPCNVVDGILGRLPLKDAVKTSILSKDWRYKWVTRQELDFSNEFFESFKEKQEAKAIIYQVLLLHRGPILKFELGGDLKSCPDIDHWILFLSKKNVQEFTLNMWSDNKYYLPSHLFTFQELRHLEVSECLFHPPPGFQGFEKLISLDFQHVTFVPATFTDFISKCPSLERLMLRWCTDFDTLEIDAPNLKFFDFTGESKSICFKNAPMLENVSVYLSVSGVLPYPSHVCCNLTKFFHYMPSLKELDLCDSTLEYLMMGGVAESPPTALNNIKSLRMSGMSFRNVEVVSGAVYLITSCPKLQELTIDCTVSAGNVVEAVVQFLRAQSMSCGVAKLLQRVEMSYFTGADVEMEFVRFILASAPALEEILIWNVAHHFVQSTQMIDDEMKQFRRASPNVRIILKVFTEEDCVFT